MKQTQQEWPPAEVLLPHLPARLQCFRTVSCRRNCPCFRAAARSRGGQV